MSPDVSVAGASVAEPLPAGGAAVRLFSGVDPNVNAEVTRLSEVLFAELAVVRFLAGMNPQVDLQQPPRAESPPAHDAHVGPHQAESLRLTLVNFQGFLLTDLHLHLAWAGLEVWITGKETSSTPAATKPTFYTEIRAL